MGDAYLAHSICAPYHGVLISVHHLLLLVWRHLGRVVETTARLRMPLVMLLHQGVVEHAIVLVGCRLRVVLGQSCLMGLLVLRMGLTLHPVWIVDSLVMLLRGEMLLHVDHVGFGLGLHL